MKTLVDTRDVLRSRSGAQCDSGAGKRLKGRGSSSFAVGAGHGGVVRAKRGGGTAGAGSVEDEGDVQPKRRAFSQGRTGPKSGTSTRLAVSGSWRGKTCSRASCRPTVRAYPPGAGKAGENSGGSGARLPPPCFPRPIRRAFSDQDAPAIRLRPPGAEEVAAALPGLRLRRPPVQVASCTRGRWPGGLTPASLGASFRRPACAGLVGRDRGNRLSAGLEGVALLNPPRGWMGDVCPLGYLPTRTGADGITVRARRLAARISQRHDWPGRERTLLPPV